jgi:hypothetical protein
MFGFITAIASAITGSFSTWSNNKKEIKAAEQQLKIALITNKARLAEAEDTHNSAWEMKQLDVSDSFLRRMSFFLIMTPFVLAIPYPQQVHEYFITVIDIVPEWWRVLFSMMVGAIWGVKVFGDKLPPILQAVKDFKNIKNSSKKE